MEKIYPNIPMNEPIPIRPSLLLAKINQAMDNEKLNERIKDLAEKFQLDGYGVVEDFLTNEEVESIREECARLAREASYNNQIFTNNNNAKSDYFVTSGDKVRVFFEKNAIDPINNKLLVEKERSLAKVGHALHSLNPIFNSITSSPKVRQIFEAIGFDRPTVVQSMVIYKNPKVGGEYTPHQDASFLCTEPIHLAGIWLALDDATLENGCLQFIPKSHHWPLKRRFVRTGKQRDGETLLEWTAPVLEFSDDKFVPIPVKRGSLVVIHGLVVHRSSANNSDKARWVYTFHAYDKGKSVYLKDNWLQMIDNDTFMEIHS